MSQHIRFICFDAPPGKAQYILIYPTILPRIAFICTDLTSSTALSKQSNQSRTNEAGFAVPTVIIGFQSSFAGGFSSTHTYIEENLYRFNGVIAGGTHVAVFDIGYIAPSTCCGLTAIDYCGGVAHRVVMLHEFFVVVVVLKSTPPAARRCSSNFAYSRSLYILHVEHCHHDSFVVGLRSNICDEC